jgi:hypothetical protein
VMKPSLFVSITCTAWHSKGHSTARHSISWHKWTVESGTPYTQPHDDSTPLLACSATTCSYWRAQAATTARCVTTMQHIRWYGMQQCWPHEHHGPLTSMAASASSLLTSVPRDCSIFTNSAESSRPLSSRSYCR